MESPFSNMCNISFFKEIGREIHVLRTLRFKLFLDATQSDVNKINKNIERVHSAPPFVSNELIDKRQVYPVRFDVLKNRFHYYLESEE